MSESVLRKIYTLQVIKPISSLGATRDHLISYVPETDVVRARVQVVYHAGYNGEEILLRNLGNLRGLDPLGCEHEVRRHLFRALQQRPESA